MTCLLMKIEKCRKKMCQLAAAYGLASPKTIRCSQYLDRLLNELDKEKSDKQTR